MTFQCFSGYEGLLTNVTCKHYWLRLSRAGCLESCADQKVSSEGSNLDEVFYEERGDPNTSQNGLSSARQRNAIKWCFASGPMMAQH